MATVIVVDGAGSTLTWWPGISRRFTCRLTARIVQFLPDMNKATTAGKFVLVKGILMILLGVVHEVALPIMGFDRIRSQMPARLAVDYAAFFEVAGAFFLLMGVIDMLSHAGIRRSEPLAWRMAWATSAFATVTGVIGVAVFREGPPFLLLFLGVTGVASLLACRSAFQPAKGQP